MAPAARKALARGEDVKLVMTLLVRDEADVVDANIAFHLNAGVDFVVATDNRSVDGTTEILEAYGREGVLHLIREREEAYLQAEWVTRMARLAATDFGADWVINTDTDEFWWPRASSLKEALSIIPERYGAVRGLWRHFVPRPGDAESLFAERMNVRLRPASALTNPLTPYATEAKWAHRADPDVVMERAAYAVGGKRLLPLRGWYPVEILHFPIRDEKQCERKYRNLAGAYAEARRSPLPYHALALGKLDGSQSDGSYFESQLVDDAMLERGLDGGLLEIDNRLRDALRALRQDDAGHPFALPSPDPRLRLPQPDLVEQMEYAADTALLDDADIIRFQTRLDRLEAELKTLRLTRGTKLRWKLARMARRR
ncbi:MAG: glycosyltransferase family 2 protein [Gaiellaceae bacterium]